MYFNNENTKKGNKTFSSEVKAQDPVHKLRTVDGLQISEKAT